MLEKLRSVEENYQSLEASLSNPELAGDPKKYAALMKEYRRLTPVVEAYREYQSTEKQEKDAEELLSDSLDADLKALAAEELRAAKAKKEALYAKLTTLLLPRDPNDDKNVLLEIRAGAGGEEAALFARDLYRMYSMYAANAGFSISTLSKNQTELGGYKELILQVSGEGAYSRFKYESGVHRVQRVPTTESQGRIQTSTVTVAVLPEAEEISVELNPADLIFESCKSSGAGGQHINKTESAIRLTHKPTGIVVECQEERSQLQNKEKALTMLRTILYDRMIREQNESISSDRRRQVGTGDRSEKIRTYNYPQSRVTDHRIGLTLHSLDAFLDGDIGGMIDALATAENAEKLQQQNS